MEDKTLVIIITKQDKCSKEITTKYKSSTDKWVNLTRNNINKIFLYEKCKESKFIDEMMGNLILRSLHGGYNVVTSSFYSDKKLNKTVFKTIIDRLHNFKIGEYYTYKVNIIEEDDDK